MIKLENTEVVGWEHAIRGMRNPMNSWKKSDSLFIPKQYCDDDFTWSLSKLCGGYAPYIKENDHKLMMSLAKGGPVHAKYRRMINAYVDITAPLYWWKEFDTYKVGTVANSCSTMHKIHANEFTKDDFSFDEDLMNEEIVFDLNVEEGEDFINHTHFEICVEHVIDICERLRLMYNHYIKRSQDSTLSESERKHFAGAAKKCWRMLIQYLPTSYNQKRTVMFNYEVLHNIYHSRKNHKLNEWHRFCDWIKQLPYSEIIIGESEENE